jgi:beta-hydroxylase
MTATPSPASGGGFRQWRRRKIKRLGQRGIRRLGGFIAQQSLIGDVPVFESSLVPWARRLEEAYPAIRREAEAMLALREHLPPFQTISPDQRNIARGDRWKVFILYGFKLRSEANCHRCPETADVLAGIPNLLSAWFSILAPHSAIPRHRGISKGIIRAHLGVIAPKDRANCWMRIGETVEHWDEGRCFVFDDTYDHEVRNDTDEERVVLIADVERPMRLAGRLLGKAFNRGIRLTAYVQDAQRNQRAWEERLQQAVERAEAMRDDDAGDD